ncbi:hypothetical protein [Mesorhizobium sp. M0500]|uniref:hypothetical protein n=1 Tax=Mesorhizobium sp. M0500 TaxID=2956953 RepID=UPI00333C0104
MQIEIKTLQQRLRVPVIFVTHDQEEALTMSDRVAVMSGGGLAQKRNGIVLPLSLPGVFVRSLMTFILAIGFYVRPALGIAALTTLLIVLVFRKALSQLGVLWCRLDASSVTGAAGPFAPRPAHRAPGRQHAKAKSRALTATQNRENNHP